VAIEEVFFNAAAYILQNHANRGGGHQ
jgi:hypothetical protein